MKPSRVLSLKRDVLPDLTTDEMRGVAGGSHIGCGVTHGNASCDACPTLPVNPCLDTLVCLTPVILTLPIEQCVVVNITNPCS